METDGASYVQITSLTCNIVIALQTLKQKLLNLYHKDHLEDKFDTELLNILNVLTIMLSIRMDLLVMILSKL